MKIVFLDEYSLNGADLSSIKKYGEYTEYTDTRPEEVIERCMSAEVVITNKVRITAETMEQLPQLKLICVAATGVNNIDVEAAEKRGIQVKNAKGYSTDSVAETTIGKAIGLFREVVYYDGFVKDGRYAASPRLFNYDRPTRLIAGSNWGIIGLGAIGHRVAELAEALRCNIAYHSVSGTERKEKYEKKTLTQLLKWADIVSIHAPLNEKTKNLIGEKEFGQMKTTAIIINVARGGIVNEQALADALNAGEIAGAGLDVFTREPINSDNPLFGVKDRYRLLLSPHNAWSSDQAIINLVQSISENIEEYVKSK